MQLVSDDDSGGVVSSPEDLVQLQLSTLSESACMRLVLLLPSTPSLMLPGCVRLVSRGCPSLLRILATPTPVVILRYV